MINDLTYNALLISAGLVTVTPLLYFTAAARRLRLSTLGFMQYLGPTIMFLLAINLYGESLESSKFISFCFIWLGLSVFTFDAIKNRAKP
jgi:chloramphenicol-sensitive protein RarD